MLKVLGTQLSTRGVNVTHHVGLEKGTLKVDVVVAQRLVDGSQNNLGHLLGTVKVVLT